MSAVTTSVTHTAHFYLQFPLLSRSITDIRLYVVDSTTRSQDFT